MQKWVCKTFFRVSFEIWRVMKIQVFQAISLLQKYFSQIHKCILFVDRILADMKSHADSSVSTYFSVAEFFFSNTEVFLSNAEVFLSNTEVFLSNTQMYFVCWQNLGRYEDLLKSFCCRLAIYFPLLLLSSETTFLQILLSLPTQNLSGCHIFLVKKHVLLLNCIEFLFCLFELLTFFILSKAD